MHFEHLNVSPSSRTYFLSNLFKEETSVFKDSKRFSISSLTLSILCVLYSTHKLYLNLSEGKEPVKTNAYKLPSPAKLMPAKKIYNHALNPDEETLRQFKHCTDQEFVTSAALMPDAHSGYVAPIGSVLITKSNIVPAWVGFDIGCGVIAMKIKGKSLVDKVKNNADKIYKEVMKKVPMGLGETHSEKAISNDNLEKLNLLIEKFSKTNPNNEVLNLIQGVSKKHLGTLGGGNHFIELSSSKDELWLVIHSGSRGLGHKIATRYMKLASNSKENYEKTIPLPDDSELGKEYLNVLDFCLEFALLNRLEMANKVLEALKSVLKEKLSMQLWVNKNHNHAIYEKGEYIHRKGATPSKKGERGVIPANMRDGAYLVKGLGNPKFLYSSSHGAGRQLSRTKAKETITMQAFKESMSGITGTISERTLDEAPQAYKSINEVMTAQKDSVKIYKHLSPIINWKG